MKVCVGSGGVFHAFDLARELERRGALGRIYTGYPTRTTPRDGIPSGMVRTFPWLSVPAVLMGRLGLHRAKRALEPYVAETFDRWTARTLDDCDIYHCLSGFGTYTHEVARRRGAVTVCDRGSSHIVTQDEILQAEATGLELRPEPIDRRVVERELAEYEACDAIVVPSAFARDSFLAQGISGDKVLRIPYGVDLAAFRPVPKEDDIFRVIFVGALSYQKGLSYLLEAVAPLRRLGIELWLIGPSAPETPRLLGPYEGLFRSFGRKPRQELSWYYSQGSVFVLASVQEGLALVLGQAMACGLPVIATHNTGAADLFDDGVEGFIVPIRHPEAIREKILWLYRNPEERAAMAARAHGGVGALGGWRDYGEQVVATYRTLLNMRESDS